MASQKRKMGDWQTPYDFALRCTKAVAAFYPNFTPCTVLEPTCGLGSFIKSANVLYSSADAIGIELNSKYAEQAQIAAPDASIVCGDVFEKAPDILSSVLSPLLVIGNPPWVHADLLSAGGRGLNSKEFGTKKFINGLDAITGNGNADIAELIFERLWSKTVGIERVFAMILKRSTARNIVKSLSDDGEHPEMTICGFDAKAVFGIDAAACFLIVSVIEQREAGKVYLCDLDDTSARKEASVIGNSLVSDGYISELACNDVHRRLVWRQGVKHDCASVMELKKTDGGYANKLGETIAIEESALYPLCKSSDLLHCPGTVLGDTKRAMPIWQKSLSDDPELVLREYPSLLRYIQARADMFDKRKSKIYADRPRFSIFGIGEYSFSEYKIAISCFSKEPRFVLCEPQDGKPVVFDDTCYFLPFDDRMSAICCLIVLRSEAVLGFFDSVADETGKRVFSKKVLSLLDIAKAAHLVDERQRKKITDMNGLPVPSDEEWARFLELVC